MRSISKKARRSRRKKPRRRPKSWTTTRRWFLLAATLLALTFGASTQVSARTLEVGPDAGPYQSLKEALAAARPGDTLRVRGGRYHGPIRIRKTVHLIGSEKPHVAGGGDSTVVAVEADGVTFSGFTVTRTGTNLSQEDAAIAVNAPEARILENRIREALFGIYLRKAHRSVVRGNRVIGMSELELERRGDVIRAWYSDRVRIADNTFRHGRDAILWFSNQADIRGNRMTRCRYGLHFMYSDSARITRNRMTENSVGAYLMYSTGLTFEQNLLAHNLRGSAMGLGLKDMDDGVIARNVLANNQVGLFIDNSPRSLDTKMRYRRNAIVYNDVGLKSLSYPPRTYVRENTFAQNHQQVRFTGGGSAPEERTDDWARNYWDDYRGYDADEDGWGDTPYRARHVFGRIQEQHPKLRLFARSPSIDAIQLAARAFPVLEPQPWLSDVQPAMEPHPVPDAPRFPEPTPLRLAAGALACLGGGLTVLLWGAPIGDDRSGRNDREAHHETAPTGSSTL